LPGHEEGIAARLAERDPDEHGDGDVRGEGKVSVQEEEPQALPGHAKPDQAQFVRECDDVVIEEDDSGGGCRAVLQKAVRGGGA
jgi:hypothetical protein